MIPTFSLIIRIVIWIYFIQATDCGVMVSLSPSSVAPKSNRPGKTSIECSLSEDTNVNAIYAMKILRKSKRETDFVTIAQVKPNKPAKIPASAPWDVNERRTKVSLGIDNIRLTSSKLQLEINTRDLVCEDAGEYKCMVIFEDDDDITVTEEASATLEVDNEDWESFMCLFNCLGGIGAIGIVGVMALIALVYAGLPAIGFGAAGVTAASIAASLQAWWFGGAVAAGSFFAILQSIGAAGIGYMAILKALFGTAAVAAAIKGGCPECRDVC